MAARSFFGEYGICRVRAWVHIRQVVLSSLLIIILFTFGKLAGSSANPRTPMVVTSVTVTSGNNLWNIASEYGDPNQYILKRIALIARLNGLNRNTVLHAGQVLIVPLRGDEKALTGGKYAEREASN